MDHSESRRSSSKKLFCLCRQPQNGEPMVQCDECEEWFHFACVGISEAPDDSTSYTCPFCDGKSGTTDTASLTSTPIKVPTPDTSNVHTSMARSMPLYTASAALSKGTPDSMKITTARKRSKNSESTDQDPANDGDDGALEMGLMALSPSMSSISPSSNQRASMSSTKEAAESSSERPRRTPRRVVKSPYGYSNDDSDDSDDDLMSKHGGSRRQFHNHREKVRRSTIRTLFDTLRKLVPATERLEGVSDRQILMEAAHHIDILTEEELHNEESLLRLRIENMTLRLRHATNTRTRPQNLTGLAAIQDAALVDTLTMEIETAQQRLTAIQNRPRLRAGSEVEDSEGNTEQQRPVSAQPKARGRATSTGSESSSSHRNSTMFQMNLEDEKKPIHDAFNSLVGLALKEFAHHST